jgi:hypothetical protein
MVVQQRKDGGRGGFPVFSEGLHLLDIKQTNTGQSKPG